MEAYFWESETGGLSAARSFFRGGDWCHDREDPGPLVAHHAPPQKGDGGTRKFGKGGLWTDKPSPVTPFPVKNREKAWREKVNGILVQTRKKTALHSLEVTPEIGGWGSKESQRKKW